MSKKLVEETFAALRAEPASEVLQMSVKFSGPMVGIWRNLMNRYPEGTVTPSDVIKDAVRLLAAAAEAERLGRPMMLKVGMAPDLQSLGVVEEHVAREVLGLKPWKDQDGESKVKDTKKALPTTSPIKTKKTLAEA